MTLLELRYLVTLADTGHFGRAAALCHVSQPTLSIAVKKLETTLGAALFERTRQGVHMTPLGGQVLMLARRMLALATEIEDLTSQASDHLHGTLSVGVLDTLGSYLLPQCVPLLQKLAPHMPLYIEEGTAVALGRQLRQGHLDAVIVSLPFELADVVTRPLYEEPFAAVLPVGHRLASEAALSLALLPPEDLLLPGSGPCVRDLLLAAMPQCQNAPSALRAMPPSATLETLRHMAASGLGVALLPRGAAEAPFYEPGLLTVRPLLEPAPVRTLALAWRVSFPRHKAIDVLRQAVQSCSSAYWNYSTARDTEYPGLLVENRDW